MHSVMDPPFPAACQLNTELDCDQDVEAEGTKLPHLPGYPRILLQDRFQMLEFLETEFCSRDLDQMAGKLWWMSKQDSSSISSLHRQIVKRRTIVVTEDPKLHLVWIHDRVFIKPLPRYLTSHTFWRNHMGVEANLRTLERFSRVRMAVLGYLRTYFYLIRSEYDFQIAQDPALRLVPKGITWEQFCSFASHLAKISDQDVSGRYIYGEIRLTRLNFYAPFLLKKSKFHRVEHQYGPYFAHFYGPILFVIGITSILLNGLQIAVGVQQAHPMQNGDQLLAFALWFCVAIMLCFCTILFSLLLLLVYKVAKEWRYAIHDRMRLTEERRSWTK